MVHHENSISLSYNILDLQMIIPVCSMHLAYNYIGLPAILTGLAVIILL